MATIGLVIRPGITAAQELAGAVVRWAKDHEHTVIFDDETARFFNGGGPGYPKEEFVKLANPIVTLGGDGTLLGIARHVKDPSPVLLGVNFGNLGFLTEIAPSELLATLQAFFAGRVKYGSRAMLQVNVLRDRKLIFASQAVNEAAVLKGTRDKLLALDLSVNRELVMRLRADGLIVATPTGSTAYSLAAGGSIVEPWLAVMLVTPVCPHSLTSRPLLLELESLVDISVPPYDGEVLLTIDGQETCALAAGDAVQITKAANSVTFVRSDSSSYFKILRTKLNWGIENKNS